jgi:SAM-dependent methyltransferase
MAPAFEENRSWEDKTMRLADLPRPIKRVLKPAYRYLRWGEFWVRDRLGMFQEEGEIARDAHRFWNETGQKVEQSSHWRGAFADDERWLALGREHLRLYEEFALMVGLTRPLKRIVEWGCGGGANAIHFTPIAEQYLGIDVSQASLDECARQLADAGLRGFVPILIDTTEPEQARSLVPAPCDLFLSTYVFELFPTPEYGLRVLNIAHDLLAEGGLAIIQIRYVTGNWKSKPKRFDYRYNFVTMTSYRIDEFWIEAERRGLMPKAVTLVPHQPLVGDGDYAYFLLQKATEPVSHRR